MEIKIGDFVMDVRRHESIYPCYPIIRKSVGLVVKVYRAFVMVKWEDGPETGIPAELLEVVEKKGKQKKDKQSKTKKKGKADKQKKDKPAKTKKKGKKKQ